MRQWASTQSKMSSTTDTISHQPSATVVNLSNISSALTGKHRLFNLLCLYGKIRRIRTDPKRKCAQVEMFSADGARNVVSHLNNHVAFERRMQCTLDVENCSSDYWQRLPFFDYTESPFNCCMPDANRPSRHIWFNSLPKAEMSEDAVLELFDRCGCPRRELPLSVIFVERRRGFVTFPNTTVALEAIAICNHIDASMQVGSHSAERVGEESLQAFLDRHLLLSFQA